jgi:hypothetical protein
VKTNVTTSSRSRRAIQQRSTKSAAEQSAIPAAISAVSTSSGTWQPQRAQSARTPQTAMAAPSKTNGVASL